MKAISISAVIKSARTLIIKHFKMLWIIVFIAGVFTRPELHAQRVKYNFNHGWKLLVEDEAGAESPAYDDKDWKAISLPYAWNQEEAFKNDIRELSTGIAWYRKSFQLPEGQSLSKVFIEFEGVRQMAEVFVNGHFIGRHENGVMAFAYDISNFVKAYPEENVIAVRTNNDWDYREKLTGVKYQWSDRNFNANYGGIPKNVYLHLSSPVYQTLPLYSSLGTTGTYVYATDIDVSERKALIHVESQVRNESPEAVDVRLLVKIKDMTGKEVASYKGDACTLPPGGMRDLHAADTLHEVSFWSWGYGYLYQLSAELEIDGEVVDAVSLRTGFRKTDFKDGMIYLNDRVIMMKGYAQRTSNEWPSIGMSAPAWLSDFSNSQVIDGNGNMFRWMHVTPWKQDVESCDRVGLIHAMPAGDSERDVSDHRWKQRTELMRDAIIYNRNNPSILFYECGNENISEAHMAEMKAIRDRYDPFGGRAIGSREMLDSEVAEYGGEMLYINKSADIPFWAMEYSRDEGLRKYWDEYTPPYHKDGDGPPYKGNPAPDYNRNQDSHAIEDVIRWFDYWEMRPGTGKRVSSGGANIIFTDSNTHHRGEENYRRSGEMDPMRIAKENYWAHKVIWDGWVDTDSIAAHIIGHWNYEPGVVKDVTVVSTADQIELFVNGMSLGMGEQCKRFLFTFNDVAFEAGTIKAIGYNKEGEKVCESMKATAGEAAALKLTSIERPGGMLADGHDLAIIQVEVVDAEGKRCPTALNMIDFKVKGEGVFVGGIAQGPGNYVGQSSLPVECGLNRVFVRSSSSAGNMKIIAKSKGLKGASLEIESHETDLTDLSEIMPYDGLPSYMKKGATPATSSYSISRIPVDIAVARSLSNQEQAAFSFDDNEMTEWSNDGLLSTGVIEYELEREAAIEQVVIKLNGWRRRSYPLSIYVDNQKVFSGESPRSLGYVTFSFDPVKGKKVRIELTGATTDEEAFDIVEITGKIDKAGLQDEATAEKGSLRILEVEFYEAVE